MYIIKFMPTVLLDGNYLTHDFSKADEDWGRESQETSEILWRGLCEVHDLHAHAKT